MPNETYDWKDIFSQGFDLTIAGTEISKLRNLNFNLVS